MEKLSADALRLALVTASMEYYKKYVEGNQDFDNSDAALPGGLFIYKNIRRQSQTSRQ